jgi:hypothetical protein
MARFDGWEEGATRVERTRASDTADRMDNTSGAVHVVRSACRER